MATLQSTNMAGPENHHTVGDTSSFMLGLLQLVIRSFLRGGFLKISPTYSMYGIYLPTNLP